MTALRQVWLTFSIYFLFQVYVLAQTYDIQDLPVVWQAVDSLKESRQFLEAAYRYEEVTLNGIHDPFTHLETAKLFTKAQKPEEAFDHIRQAITYGFSNKSYLVRDKTLASLKAIDKAQWDQILCLLDTVINNRSNPEEVRIITSDLPLFYQAYHQALQDTAKADSVFYHAYIAAGSQGLHAMYAGNIGSVDRLSQTVLSTEKKFYASIEDVVLAPDFICESDIRNALKKMKALYGQATFPDIYILMGMHNTGAKESSTGPGLLVCAEFFTRSAQVDTSELSPFHKAAWYPSRQLTWITIHELCHNLQNNTTPSTLLDFAIMEGSCDFIASVVLEEDPGFLPYHAYGQQHEEALWREFQEEMYFKNVENWLWNNAFDSRNINRPADLGYYIGYKICESYYHHADDKKRAIREMLNIRNFYKFLQKSRYDKNI